MTDSEARVRQAIEGLGYDFSRFTVPHFIGHLERLRQRAIIVRAYSFSRELYGMLVRSETADYVFFNQHTHQVHKVHNILHELGHIVLDHTCHNLDVVLTMINQARPVLPDMLPLAGQFRMVEPTHTVEEHEAELFVRYLQREIINANRIEHLTCRASSIEDLDRFTRCLGYHD